MGKKRGYILAVLGILVFAMLFSLNGCKKEESNICKVDDNASSCNVDGNPDTANQTNECSVDSDCVPQDCCHPTSCIPASKKGVCNMACTLDCKPGTMDCGQGHCACNANKCEAVMNS